jgi:hypothetical protein
VSPTVRHDPTAYELDLVTPVAGPRRARAYAIGLIALALLLTAALAARGAGFPEPGLLLVLAIPLALCMNRYLIYVNELGVTADAAVLFAAVVAFRGEAQWLGPLVLALLAGPLDARHWGARAFTRMAYNSGSTALVVATGLAVFVPISRALGTGWEATLAAAAVTAVPYVVAESLLGVMLAMLLGERADDAARLQLPLNAIALPLAVVGAGAGIAVVGVGWWLGLVLLLPVPFTPEIVFVLLPRRTAATVRWLAVAVVALAASVLLASPLARDAAGLLAVACLVFADRRPTTTRARWFPPLLALVVTIPWAAFTVGLPGPTVAIVVAAGAGAVTFVLLVAARVIGGVTAGWSLPVVLMSAVAARLWGLSGRFGSVVFVAVVAAALVLASCSGAPPWPSRALTRVRARPVRLAVDALATAAIVCAVATTLTSGTTAADLGVVTATLLEMTVVIAAFAVHLWRFDPRRRARELALLLTVGAIGVVVVPGLAPLVAAFGALVAARVARATPGAHP